MTIESLQTVQNNYGDHLSSCEVCDIKSGKHCSLGINLRTAYREIVKTNILSSRALFISGMANGDRACSVTGGHLYHGHSNA